MKAAVTVNERLGTPIRKKCLLQGGHDQWIIIALAYHVANDLTGVEIFNGA